MEENGKSERWFDVSQTQNTHVVVCFWLYQTVCLHVHVCVHTYAHTSEYGDGSGLAGSIVTQEGSDLTFIHVQVQFVHSALSLFLPLLAHKQSAQRTLFSNSISHS